jgi:hypothetical protein
VNGHCECVNWARDASDSLAEHHPLCPKKPSDGTYPRAPGEPKVADFTDRKRVGPNCSDNPSV